MRPPNVVEPSITSLPVDLAVVLESRCRHVFELWEKLRGNRFAPAWREFDFLCLPPDEIAHIRVVDVRDDPFDLVYRFWGTGLVAILGSERTGKSLLDVSSPRVADAVAEYRQVIEARAPYAFIYDAKTTRQTLPLFAPAIRLPFSDDGKTVTQVLGYSDFQSNSDRWVEVFRNSGAIRGNVT